MEGATPQIGTIGVAWTHTADVLNRYGNLFVTKYRERFLQEGKNASGALLDSLRYEIVTEGATIAVDVHWLDYWKRIEEGTEPGTWVNESDLEKWIVAKPIIPRPFRNGRYPTIEQLAYLIARKIYNFGIEAVPIAEPALNEVNEQMMQDVENAITMDVGEWVDATMNVIKL